MRKDFIQGYFMVCISFPIIESKDGNWFYFDFIASIVPQYTSIWYALGSTTTLRTSKRSEGRVMSEEERDTVFAVPLDVFLCAVWRFNVSESLDNFFMSVFLHPAST